MTGYLCWKIIGFYKFKSLCESVLEMYLHLGFSSAAHFFTCWSSPFEILCGMNFAGVFLFRNLYEPCKTNLSLHGMEVLQWKFQLLPRVVVMLVHELCASWHWLLNSLNTLVAVWTLTHCSLVTHICFKLGHQWLRKWHVFCLVSSHSLNQCWLIVNWTHRNKIQWTFDPNTNIFFEEKGFKMLLTKCEPFWSDLGLLTLEYWCPNQSDIQFPSQQGYITVMSHEHHGILNYKQLNCLFNNFRLITRQTPKLRYWSSLDC